MQGIGHVLVGVMLLGLCSCDKNEGPSPLGADGVPVVRAPAPKATSMPAAPPPIRRAAAKRAAWAPAGLACDRLVPKVMLDAITGIKTAVGPVPEPLAANKRAIRCENRSTKIGEAFGYYVECGKRARKQYASLRRRVRRRSKSRRGPWRGGFETRGSFTFLGEKKRCYGQVVGRLLLQQRRLGERIAAEIARNLEGR